MANSATLGRRQTIIAAAQRLAVKRGYSGFTVEDLAAAVGCSRRTLFNHVSSKEEAVLGVLPEITEEQVGVLRAGGPTGDLVEDLVATIIDCLGGDDATAEDWQRLQDVVRRNPELLVRVQDHLDELRDSLVTHLAARDGVSEEQARITLSVTAAVVGLAVEGLIEDPGAGSLRERTHHNLALAREVLSPAGRPGTTARRSTQPG
ncbi:TetR/AcrR family transcriptional regulator [Janibacter cremeus]|uniref:TetR/AcrR family transcriptional regulator n=1 Tax=Janibacter cremeus TaxID=1285192 RepID=UPI0023F8C7F1|nr:TetR/AcrR family transcriptional regulator [Janibacter cremeus]WEV76971.1 TetR/AcrR family transcriptional regulator [Janibacter cremeus]